jgi:hypothetical protein
MKIAHPEANTRKTFLTKRHFDFMADIITIELGFRQQVAADALKNPPKLSFRWRSRDSSIGAGLFYCDGNQILACKESRDNGYVKRKSRRSLNVDSPIRWITNPPEGFQVCSGPTIPFKGRVLPGMMRQEWGRSPATCSGQVELCR